MVAHCFDDHLLQFLDPVDGTVKVKLVHNSTGASAAGMDSRATGERHDFWATFTNKSQTAARYAATLEGTYKMFWDSIRRNITA
jgi:hypothetical protein